MGTMLIHTHTHTHTYIYIYIYIYVCMYVCIKKKSFKCIQKSFQTTSECKHTNQYSMAYMSIF